jgi:hypothetical protein
MARYEYIIIHLGLDINTSFPITLSGIGHTPADMMYSDYYGFFTFGESGAWTVEVPVDSDLP